MLIEKNNNTLPDEVYHHMFVCDLLKSSSSGGISPLSTKRNRMLNENICHELARYIKGIQSVLTSNFMADSRSENHLQNYMRFIGKSKNFSGMASTKPNNHKLKIHRPKEDNKTRHQPIKSYYSIIYPLKAIKNKV